MKGSFTALPSTSGLAMSARRSATDTAQAIDIYAGRRSMKGNAHCLDLDLWVGDGCAEVQRPMRPNPLISMLVGGT